MRRFHSPADAALRACRRAMALAFDVGLGPHFRKRHPLDCGKARCGICHPEKLRPRRPTRAERRAERDLRDAQGAS